MASSLRELKFLACSCSAHVLPEVRDALWGNIGYRMVLAADQAPDEVLVAGVPFLLGGDPVGRRRHEACHEEQRARFAPSWVPAWFPQSWRAWLGSADFWTAYRKEHHQNGFVNNAFEIEARRAEHPELVRRDGAGGIGEDDLTPTELPPR